jgi:FkbM family methyltransferase
MIQSAQFCESHAILDYFSARAEPGVMIDVGAHLGSTLRPYVKRGWRVIAAEPDPAKIPRLKRFVDSPGFTLLPLAVGDQEEASLPFFTSAESTGISSLIAFRNSHVQTTTVKATTLARIIDDHDVDTIDFLKIDTEGFDYRVLQGFPWWKLRPEVILCEFDEQKTRGVDYDYRALGDLLVSQGHHVYLSEWLPIVRYGGNHRWRSVRRYPCELIDAAAWGNFIAIRANGDVDRLEMLLPLGERESAD